MKKEDVLFNSESGYDHKNILNRSTIKIEEEVLDQIDKGVTYEWLKKTLEEKKIPLFVYKTQITLHGIFPEFDTIRTFGYQNIFQNKNKSIGIKYSAIDGEKRKRIATKLKYLGFRYSVKSTDHYYGIFKEIDKDTFEKVKAEMFALYNKVDTSLFSGTRQLYVAQGYGTKYLVLEIRINLIPEEDVDRFCLNMGITEEFIKAEELKRKKAENLRQAEYDAEKIKRDQGKKDEKDLHAAELIQLENYPFHERTTETGIYLKIQFDHNDKLVFMKIKTYYPTKRSKKPRVTRETFKTLDEALNRELSTREWSDSILSSPLRNVYAI